MSQLKRFGWWILYGNQPDERGKVIPAGPGGWPPQLTIVSTPPLRTTLWWIRWIVKGYWIKMGWRRLTTCRGGCDPRNLYDMCICMVCGREQPWEKEHRKAKKENAK